MFCDILGAQNIAGGRSPKIPYSTIAVKGKPYGAAKKGWSGKKIIPPSIFEARCSVMEQTVLAVEGCNIALMALLDY